MFRGLMPFFSTDWWLRWNLLVSASDASANGYWVSTSMWTQEEVRQAGRTRGRDRSFAREKGDEDMAIEEAKTIVSGDTAKLRQLGVDLEFPEVATSGLALSRWVPRFWGAWQHAQNIQVLEARALLMFALSLHGRDARQIVIVDNLGVCLCVDRCRSKNFELPNQMRVSASCVLARKLKPTVNQVAVVILSLVFPTC